MRRVPEPAGQRSAASGSLLRQDALGLCADEAHVGGVAEGIERAAATWEGT